MAIRIGCGSWGDQEYVGLLYPPGLPAAKRLQGYAEWFDHIEVNSSYYAVPRRPVVENWIRQTPKDFIFDFKLHRHILSSLAKGKDLLAYTLEQVEPLIQKKKLGTFLLLLSPHFRPEKHSLKELDLLVEKIQPHPLAIELRSRGWIEGKNRATTLAYFRERGVAWVALDMPRLEDDSLLPPIDEVTQPKLAYLRLHGRNRKYLESESAAERHEYLYSARELKEIVVRIRQLAKRAKDVHVVANNHARDYAPRTALALKRLLDQA
jgi:uncharacterized protein YecE (DUF72 family)